EPEGREGRAKGALVAQRATDDVDDEGTARRERAVDDAGEPEHEAAADGRERRERREGGAAGAPQLDGGEPRDEGAEHEARGPLRRRGEPEEAKWKPDDHERQDAREQEAPVDVAAVPRNEDQR